MDPKSDTKNWLAETLNLLEAEGAEPGTEALSPTMVLGRLGLEDAPEATVALQDLAQEAPEFAARQRDRMAQLRPMPSALAKKKVADTPLPASLGRFELVDELGRGGMGKVLSAWDPELGRLVAVKILLDTAKNSRNLLQRFVTEAKVTAQLEHPNIVPVYDIGLSRDGEVYFAMRRVQGRSLWSVLSALRRGERTTKDRWTRHRLLQAFVQVCNAVGYAHDRNVLHRDVKPENIMLGGHGEVLLLDWGLARLIGSSENMSASMSMPTIEPVGTVVGSVLGSPGYMSPEQAAGAVDQMDARTDVWSLGSVLYEMLCYVKAYPGKSAETVLSATKSGLPADPRERAPLRGVPDVLAEICMRAMATEPEDRFSSANELGEAVEAFLAGDLRREAALRRVVEAATAFADYERLVRETEEHAGRLRKLEKEVKPWLPLSEKRELLDARQRTRDLERARAESFSATLAGCEQALSQDPTNGEAHTLLAKASFQRMLEAEATGHEIDRILYRDRVLRHGPPQLKAQLTARGTLRLKTEPVGAEVICQRFDTEPLCWTLGPERSLGNTPLEDLELEAGSYRLTLRAEGYADTVYPVFLERGGRWDSGETPVPLYRREQIGAGWVYVPPGPFLYQGDPYHSDSLPTSMPYLEGFFVQRLQVTMEEYCVFINAVAEQDPDEAWSRVPRQASELKDGSGHYWLRPEPGEKYVVPEIDRDGDFWEPDWPASAMNWHDAIAYAEWFGGKLGVKAWLPSEMQWEKAARGVDGRYFPWGNHWDSSLAAGRDSQPGRPSPTPVGTFPGDRSVYGMCDAGGCSQDWCGDLSYNDDSGRRPVRGGHWLGRGDGSRVTRRHGVYPSRVISSQSFRLVRSEPLPD